MVLFMVDGRRGMTGADEELAKIMRKLDKPVLLGVNKIEELDRAREEVAEFWRLGLGEPYPLSALHGVGSGDLLSAVVERLDEVPPALASPFLHALLLRLPYSSDSSFDSSFYNSAHYSTYYSAHYSPCDAGAAGAGDARRTAVQSREGRGRPAPEGVHRRPAQLGQVVAAQQAARRP